MSKTPSGITNDQGAVIMQKYLLKFIEWSTKLIGKFHLPWTERILKDVQIRDILESAEPTDVLCVTSGGFLSTWIQETFLRGRFSHAAFVVDWETITDSTAIGVDTRDMLSVLIGYYHVALLRPNVSDDSKRKMLEAYQWVKKLDADDNIEYDYTLVSNEIRLDGAPDKIQCSQYTAWVLNRGVSGFMEPRKRYGMLTYAPDDFYKAVGKGKFSIVREY